MAEQLTRAEVLEGYGNVILTFKPYYKYIKPYYKHTCLFRGTAPDGTIITAYLGGDCMTTTREVLDGLQNATFWRSVIVEDGDTGRRLFGADADKKAGGD